MITVDGALYRPNCIGGYNVREVSYDGGVTWTIDINFRTPCISGSSSGTGGGPGLCLATTGFFPIMVGSPCIAGIRYNLFQTITLVYDLFGCLTFSYGPVTAVAVDCCTTTCLPSTGSSGSSSGSQVACIGQPCTYCTTGTTPLTYAFTIPAALAGNLCPNWPAGSWLVSQALAPGTCAWYQQKGDQYASLYLLYDNVHGQFFFDLVIYDSANNWYLEWVYFFFPGNRTPVNCNTPYTLAFVSATCQPGYGDGPYSQPVTITPALENCGGGGGGSSGTGGGTGGVCCGCLTTPAVYRLTAMAGITNGTCTKCTNYNGTFDLTTNGACQWKSARFAGCASPAVPALGGWQLYCDTANWYLIPEDILVTDTDFIYYVKAKSGWNCNGINVMALAGTAVACLTFPATATVTAV